MINASISLEITNKTIDRLETIELPIQLGLYTYDNYIEVEEKLYSIIKNSKPKINVIHLPLDILKQEYKEIINILNKLVDATKCVNFVIHPNNSIKLFLNYIESTKSTWFNLCIENFQFKRKKELRTPLAIYKLCNQYNIHMTFDTCHSELIWFDQKIFSELSPFIKVIHLSNRNGKNEHIPFNDKNGELNLVKFVNDLKNKYQWEGEIVLEYMSDYENKLYSNFAYLERLLS